jgi:hypothetical protein
MELKRKSCKKIASAVAQILFLIPVSCATLLLTMCTVGLKPPLRKARRIDIEPSRTTSEVP